MQELIRVSPANVAGVCIGLPRSLRMAFRFAARIRRGTLDAVMPDGRQYRFTGPEAGPTATLIVKDPAFARRFIGEGDIGLAETYLRGEWDTPDLTQFLYLFSVNHDLIASLLGGKPIIRLVQLMRHWLNRNTRRRARRNIEAHYDLGNRFYAAWLDDTMTYSSALFDRGANDLTAAQQHKYKVMAERLGLAPGQRVLEIGCGWGGFAEYAARAHGVQVVGLTISREQHEYASTRIAAAGLADMVDIRLKDYRDERGSYERIVSIEMIEAVGEDYWPTYFRQLHDRLVSGGIAGIQAITIQDKYFAGYRRELDFIRRYVFPGGMLPSPSRLKMLGQQFSLPLVAETVFGDDYARTLAAWRARFRAAWPNLVPMGFDERFRRLWEYYLAYCEAGFLARNIDVRQMVFARID
ncbi:MAG: class I SAM-dependent methyltransferase [Proteobacteria bacterium]|nr:class I SAM-dependent methyltransferase [Pseudomonadota bacterium]